MVLLLPAEDVSVEKGLEEANMIEERSNDLHESFCDSACT